jgi:nucleoside-diphosphate-sugar epimerase
MLELRRCDFAEVEPFFRWFNFAGFIAVKDRHGGGARRDILLAPPAMSSTAPRRVLVTGATGFLGRALLHRLAAAGPGGPECLALVRPGQGLDLPATRVELDLHERGGQDLVPEGVDAVVHLAAARDRGDPAPRLVPEQVRLHTDATARLLEAARHRGVRIFVQVSTTSVLKPGVDPSALCGDDAPLVEAPGHPYALTKRWAEDLAILYRESFAAVPIVRPAMVYGPGQRSGGWLARLADQLRRGEIVRVTPPSGNLFAPVYVTDVADVLERVLLAPSNATFSVSGEPISERAIIDHLASHFGVPVRIEEETEEACSYAIANARLDELYPDRARTSWAEGVRRTWAGNRPGSPVS